MKLNTKLFFTIIIILLTIYHLSIHNNLEKMFFQTYFDYNKIRRPLNYCSNILNSSKLTCAGMPSGHAETSMIFASLLYIYKIIPLWLAIIIVIISIGDRIIRNKHTLFQISIGLLVGALYSFIYRYFNLSIYGFLIVFFIGFVLALLIVYKIDKKVNGPIPNWVDKNMLSCIKKKQESPFYIKLGSIYVNSIIHNTTFISWTYLEKTLDIIIERIRKSGINYDAVVGIKTGGAIISDYISLKLGLPSYKIKITRKEYDCDKQPKHSLDDMFKKNIFENGEYNICEGIHDNLHGKNVILIDEIVATGKTMDEAYNYLKEIKHVNEIYPSCVAFYKWIYKGNLNIDNVINGTVLVWPWGYDN
jgi:hypoxanthine phosphoribosyltransferase